MDTVKNNNASQPQPQTASNPSGTAIENPFENKQPVDRDLDQAKEELEKEQQFKEAQTERD